MQRVSRHRTDDGLGYLTPTLNKLATLHNFTIESQVQYHAPLAFHPRDLQVNDKTVHGLTAEDLTVFLNSAEWTLCELVFVCCQSSCS